MANFVLPEKVISPPVAVSIGKTEGIKPAFLKKTKVALVQIWQRSQIKIKQTALIIYQKIKSARLLKGLKSSKQKGEPQAVKIPESIAQQKTLKTRIVFFKGLFPQIKIKFLAWRKKDDFNNLKKFFNQKPEGRLILDKASEPKNQKGEQPVARVKDYELLMQKRQDTDFNGFMTNGQKEPSYKFKRLSFDKVLAPEGPEERVLSPTTESSRKLSRTVVKQVKTKNIKKAEQRLSRLRQEEQALISQISQRPQDVRPYEKLAEVYLKMKNYQDAQASWGYILKLKPNYKKAQRALAKIKKMLHNKRMPE